MPSGRWKVAEISVKPATSTNFSPEVFKCYAELPVAQQRPDFYQFLIESSVHLALQDANSVAAAASAASLVYLHLQYEIVFPNYFQCNHPPTNFPAVSTEQP